MSLIQQFLQQNLSKDLNHQLLAQIQQQNSAVQCLVSNLQGLRDKDNLQSIGNKISRIESFLQLKKQVVSTLQPLNTNTSAVFQWVMNTLINNSFLYQMIKRQQFFVHKQLVEIGKKTLLEDNYLQQLHQDTDFANKIIRELHLLNQQKSIKNMNRQKVKEIDFGMELFEQKIKAFDERVAKFNTQMLLFLRKIYSFDEKIKNQFYQHFSTESFEPQTPPSSQSRKNGFTRQNSQKSHISIDSNNKQSTVKMIRPKQFFQTQGTPRKCLQTQANQAGQKPKANQIKSMIQKKRLNLQDRGSTHNEIKSSLYQNRGSLYQNRGSLYQNRGSLYQNRGSMMQKRGSMIENKRTSIDYYNTRRPSQKYQQTLLQDEFSSMNKTLSTLNYYNRPQPSNMLYTTTNFGQQVRLPTKWATNSRSSISYYPSR